ncbi:hypothetical protein [Escherichia marmotae]|uniref:hypothetical protein n=1 Tax=Escherichia marmotae TaxID=1499973 RepID=UPI0027E11B5B|nr:hypothetical protein [Escherichia marmotae]
MGRWWRYKWITFHPSLTIFIGAAARKGLFLTMEETRLAREAKDALMAELALEY